MANTLIYERPSLEEFTAEERARLLRYCARATSDAHVAEDLVQQTLQEAWLHADRLYAPELRMPWLLGIARNVTLRWLRSHGREAARHVRLASADGEADLPAESEPIDDADPLLEIERRDLADLLDRALASLPSTTRAVLVGRYMADMSQAELAAGLGLSEGAVEARLQRGKAALRRLLTTTFRDQLAAYGLHTAETYAWETTRVWCASCGRHRLMAQFPAAPGPVAFRCPGCQPDPAMPNSEYRLTNSHFLQLIGGISRPRAVLNRVASWVYPYFTQGVEAGWAPCTNCGHRSPLRIEQFFDSVKSSTPLYRIVVVCPACDEGVSTSLWGLAQALAPVRQFWQQHGRIRTLPPYEVEAEGQQALVSRFESVTTAAGLTVVMARDSFRLLHVEGDPAEQGDI